MPEQHGVTLQESVQRRRAGKIAGIVCVKFLPPVGRMEPDKIEAARQTGPTRRRSRSDRTHRNPA